MGEGRWLQFLSHLYKALEYLNFSVHCPIGSLTGTELLFKLFTLHRLNFVFVDMKLRDSSKYNLYSGKFLETYRASPIFL